MQVGVAAKPDDEIDLRVDDGKYGLIPGLVWAFRIHQDGTPEALPIDRPIEHSRDGWVWLHFNLADTRATQWCSSMKVSPAALALFTARDTHQQLHTSDSSIYGILSDLGRDLTETNDQFAHLHFIMTERALFSGRHHALAAPEKARSLLEKGQRKLPSVAALLELIVENVADAVDGLADKLGSELDSIEDALISGSKSSERQDLARVRRTGVKLHRQLAGLRTLFHRLERDGLDELKPTLRLEASKLAQRLDALDHDIIEVRDRARLLQEEMSAATADESNRALNILSVLTTVFLPPTLITGIFGMNTKGLPFTDDPDGFMWASIMMVGSVVGVYLLMKRIGALRF